MRPQLRKRSLNERRKRPQNEEQTNNTTRRSFRFCGQSEVFVRKRRKMTMTTKAMTPKLETVTPTSTKAKLVWWRKLQNVKVNHGCVLIPSLLTRMTWRASPPCRRRQRLSHLLLVAAISSAENAASRSRRNRLPRCTRLRRSVTGAGRADSATSSKGCGRIPSKYIRLKLIQRER